MLAAMMSRRSSALPPSPFRYFNSSPEEIRLMAKPDSATGRAATITCQGDRRAPKTVPPSVRMPPSVAKLTDTPCS